MKKILLLPLLVAVFAGGFFVRSLFPAPIPVCSLPLNLPPAEAKVVEPIADSQSVADYQKGYDAGLEKAQAAVADMRCFQDTVQANSHRITGVISSVADSAFEIQMNASSLNPFLDGKVTKKVGVTDKTVIQKQLSKSDEDYQKEYLVYKSLIEKLKPPVPGEEDPQVRPEKPQKYSMQALSFDDLKIGQQVTVETAADVRTSDVFDATMVNLLAEAQSIQPQDDPGLKQDIPK